MLVFLSQIPDEFATAPESPLRSRLLYTLGRQQQSCTSRVSRSRTLFASPSELRCWRFR